jgi:integrase
MPALLAELEKAPGTTWQQRWEARGLNDGTLVPADLVSGKKDRGRMTTSARILFCLRVVRPSLKALRAARYPRLAEHLRLAADDPLLDKFVDHVRGSEAHVVQQGLALVDVAQALVVFDISLADLTPGVLLHYALTSRELTGYRHMPVAGATWQLLRSMGVFPPSSPHSLRAALLQGQLTIEQLVDRDRSATPGVREVFIEYLRRRAVGLDYNTLSQLAHLLTQLFWRNVEKVNPQQVGLQLSEETYQQWKQSVSVLPNGGRRLNLLNILMKIRSFYLDLQSWAYDDPGLWGPWVAPCPVRESEVRRTHVARRRINERMADRTRTHQPLLPLLFDHVTNRWLYHRDLLAATQAAGIGEYFTYDGVQWQRTASENDRRYVQRGEDYRLRAVNRDTGELVNVSLEEGAFFDWAVVEILRHAGLRIEELLELTHLSIRNYQRTNGEVIALLVIAPSKADRERVIPMSAELFHPIAQVVKRLRSQYGTVPLAHSYDPYERVWKASLPYLFQRLNGLHRSAVTPTTIRRRLQACCAELAKIHPEFEGVNFAPHDFRRLFATELVNSGLPIHIGAALLGHLSIETTRGYVAVFDEVVVLHYQQFLDRRREQRPPEEYRDPTSVEWTEFEEHFDKRKVELGSCGRPHGTPCAHEHACIRCPMLTLNPKMVPRLDELEADLVERRAHALANGWKGEIEGVDLTLTFLRSKRTQTRRAVSLGMPALPATSVQPGAQ